MHPSKTSELQPRRVRVVFLAVGLTVCLCVANVLRQQSATPNADSASRRLIVSRGAHPGQDRSHEVQTQSNLQTAAKDEAATITTREPLNPRRPTRTLRPPPPPPEPVRQKCPPPASLRSNEVKHTGKKALVVYGVTHRSSGAVFDVEMDNLDFFARHGLLPAGLKTALFTQVDFVFQRVLLNDPPDDQNQTNRLKSDRPAHHIVTPPLQSPQECPLHTSTLALANVRVLRQPDGPCDLCAISRLLGHLKIDVDSSEYAFMMVLNSGARGPFFTGESPTEGNGHGNNKMKKGNEPLGEEGETKEADDRPLPYTYVDHFALGGEAEFSGIVVTATAANSPHMPHIQTYAFGFPVRALHAISPVLSNACTPGSKFDCIQRSEIVMAKTLMEGGFKVRSLLHPSHRENAFTNLDAFGQHIAPINPFGLDHVDPCQLVFPKYGGEMLEVGFFRKGYVEDILRQTTAQQARAERRRTTSTFKGDLLDRLYRDC